MYYRIKILQLNEYTLIKQYDEAKQYVLRSKDLLTMFAVSYNIKVIIIIKIEIRRKLNPFKSDHNSSLIWLLWEVEMMDRQHHLKYRWNKKFYFDSDLSVWLKGSRALEYSLLAIITFWRQVVIKSAIRTSGLPPIKTTTDRHFVRRARKKVVPSNEPKGDPMKEIVKVREEIVSGSAR